MLVSKMKWNYDVTLTTVTFQHNMLCKRMSPLLVGGKGSGNVGLDV